MKLLSVITIIVAILSRACSSFAFVISPFTSFPIVSHSSCSLYMAYELAAEPDGGEELVQIGTMAGTRLKKMGPATDFKSADGAPCYLFWLSSVVEGVLIKEIRTTVEKDASKKANFPGFRKGQIPPYAQPQMTMFAVQEGIIKTCEAAVDAYGLKSLPGSDGSVDVQESVKEMIKGYKVGNPIQFTGTFKGTFDSDKPQPKKEVETEITKEIVID